MSDTFLSALTAAGGNSRMARSMRAKLQWRDRYGRWIEMGRGVKFKVRGSDGATRSVIGSFVGAKDAQTGQVYVSKDPNGLPDGFYDVSSSNAQEFVANLDESQLAERGITLGKDANGQAVGERASEAVPNVNELVRADAPEGWVAEKGTFGGKKVIQTGDGDFRIHYAGKDDTVLLEDRRGNPGQADPQRSVAEAFKKVNDVDIQREESGDQNYTSIADGAAEKVSSMSRDDKISQIKGNERTLANDRAPLNAKQAAMDVNTQLEKELADAGDPYDPEGKDSDEQLAARKGATAAEPKAAATPVTTGDIDTSTFDVAPEGFLVPTGKRTDDISPQGLANFMTTEKERLGKGGTRLVVDTDTNSAEIYNSADTLDNAKAQAGGIGQDTVLDLENGATVSVSKDAVDSDDTPNLDAPTGDAPNAEDRNPDAVEPRADDTGADAPVRDQPDAEAERAEPAAGDPADAPSPEPRPSAAPGSVEDLKARRAQIQAALDNSGDPKDIIALNEQADELDNRIATLDRDIPSNDEARDRDEARPDPEDLSPDDRDAPERFQEGKVSTGPRADSWDPVEPAAPDTSDEATKKSLDNLADQINGLEEQQNRLQDEMERGASGRGDDEISADIDEVFNKLADLQAQYEKLDRGPADENAEPEMTLADKLDSAWAATDPYPDSWIDKRERAALRILRDAEKNGNLEEVIKIRLSQEEKDALSDEIAAAVGIERTKPEPEPTDAPSAPEAPAQPLTSTKKGDRVAVGSPDGKIGIVTDPSDKPRGFSTVDMENGERGGGNFPNNRLFAPSEATDDERADRAEQAKDDAADERAGLSEDEYGRTPDQVESDRIENARDDAEQAYEDGYNRANGLDGSEPEQAPESAPEAPEAPQEAPAAAEGTPDLNALPVEDFSETLREMGNWRVRQKDDGSLELFQPGDILDATKPGMTRPLEHIYRVISEDEYNGINENGFMQSDGRMNIAESEGTVATHRDPSFYAPGAVGERGRIVRMDYNPEDGWWVDSDGYVKTPNQIPAERFTAQSDWTVGVGRNATSPDDPRLPRMLVNGLDNEIGYSISLANSDWSTAGDQRPAFNQAGDDLRLAQRRATHGGDGTTPNYDYQTTDEDARAYIAEARRVVEGIEFNGKEEALSSLNSADDMLDQRGNSSASAPEAPEARTEAPAPAIEPTEVGPAGDVTPEAGREIKDLPVGELRDGDYIEHPGTGNIVQITNMDSEFDDDEGATKFTFSFASRNDDEDDENNTAGLVELWSTEKVDTYSGFDAAPSEPEDPTSSALRKALAGEELTDDEQAIVDRVTVDNANKTHEDRLRDAQSALALREADRQALLLQDDYDEAEYERLTDLRDWAKYEVDRLGPADEIPADAEADYADWANTQREADLDSEFGPIEQITQAIANRDTEMSQVDSGEGTGGLYEPGDDPNNVSSGHVNQIAVAKAKLQGKDIPEDERARIQDALDSDALTDNEVARIAAEIDSRPNRANTVSIPRPEQEQPEYLSNADVDIINAERDDPNFVFDEDLTWRRILEEFPNATQLENGDLILDTTSNKGKRYDTMIRRTNKNRFLVYVMETDGTGNRRAKRIGNTEWHSYEALEKRIQQGRKLINSKSPAGSLARRKDQPTEYLGTQAFPQDDFLGDIGNPDAPVPTTGDKKFDRLLEAVASHLRNGDADLSGIEAHLQDMDPGANAINTIMNAVIGRAQDHYRPDGVNPYQMYDGETAQIGDYFDWTDWHQEKDWWLPNGQLNPNRKPNKYYGQVQRGRVVGYVKENTDGKGHTYGDHVWVQLQNPDGSWGNWVKRSAQTLRLSDENSPLGLPFFSKKEEWRSDPEALARRFRVPNAAADEPVMTQERPRRDLPASRRVRFTPRGYLAGYSNVPVPNSAPEIVGMINRGDITPSIRPASQARPGMLITRMDDNGNSFVDSIIRVENLGDGGFRIHAARPDGKGSANVDSFVVPGDADIAIWSFPELPAPRQPEPDNARRGELVQFEQGNGLVEGVVLFDDGKGNMTVAASGNETIDILESDITPVESPEVTAAERTDLLDSFDEYQLPQHIKDLIEAGVLSPSLTKDRYNTLQRVVRSFRPSSSLMSMIDRILAMIGATPQQRSDARSYFNN